MGKVLASMLCLLMVLFLASCEDNGPTQTVENDAATWSVMDTLHPIPYIGSRHALLVGVSRFNDKEWCELNAHNDLALLDKSLRRHGFEVSILEDSAATCDNIKMSIWELCGAANKGDTVLIHFSSHGQQVYSESSIETEPDMLDEAVIPFDARFKKCDGYCGQNHLLDDTLNKYVSLLSDGLGEDGLVMVFVDACHSGDIDRAPSAGMPSRTVRGVSDIFGTDSLPEHRIDSLRRSYRKKDNVPIVGGCDIAYVSACGSDELNKEIVVDGKGYGSLSYAVACALRYKDFTTAVPFLSLVDSLMKTGPSAQVPVIRTNLAEWRHTDCRTEKGMTAGDGRDSSNRVFWLIASVGLVILVLISILLIWKRRR